MRSISPPAPTAPPSSSACARWRPRSRACLPKRRSAIEAWHEAKTAREVRSLVAESQRLERALRTYRDDDRVVNGRTANTILDIEDRIAAVDARLGRERGDQSASRETMKLWLERVRLLDALVNLHATHVAYVGL
jgi:hypothetical protein